MDSREHQTFAADCASPSTACDPPTTIERLQRWVNHNRALTAAAVAFVGTGVFLVWRRRSMYRQKRRARRAATGAKTEVVILAGSAYSPMTKSLAVDLERRGFLVYIPVSSLEEEAVIAELRLADVQGLNFDITSTDSTADMLDRFSEKLLNPQRHGTSRLHLASLVLLPPYSSMQPVAPITSLPSQVWSDILNTQVLYPISLTHAFLPLLLGSSSPSNPSQRPTFVLLTPSNVPALHPPYHATESLTTDALTSYFTTLRAELSPPLQPIHLCLGAFDFNTPAHPTRSDVALARRSIYETSSASSSSSPAGLLPTTTTISAGLRRHSKGSPLRDLHNSVFDAIVGQSSGTVFVGLGARTYTMIGAWAPRSLVDWMMVGPTSGDTIGWKPLQQRQPRRQQQHQSSGLRRGSWQSGSDGGSGGDSGDGGSGSSGERLGRSAEWENVAPSPSSS